MATENLLLCESLTVSGNNLSASTDDYIFVKHGNTDGDVVPCTAGDLVAGVSQETGKNDENISVAKEGVSKVRCGTTVTQGQHVRPNASGNAVPLLDLNPGGGIAQAAGATNDLIPVLLTFTFSGSSN